MFGRIHIKRGVKRTAGWLAVANALVSSRSSAIHGCVLVYHRVADVGFIDPRVDDWNVPPRRFERQIAALCDMGQIVPLPDLPKMIKSGNSSDRPFICLTFDDGFANFHRNVLPVLVRYSVPATLFVPTVTIGGTEPMPFDRWGIKNRHRVTEDAWRPLRWNELQECFDSGLVTIGSHSHLHRNARDWEPSDLKEEADRSRDILAGRFGADRIQCYAYPYGSSRLGQVTDAYIEAVRSAGYQLAVSTNLGLATPDSDPFLLPRIEAHPLDTTAVLRAKTRGYLLPYFVTGWMRRASRNAR
jgi:peptidoglycan/xylan/chitin deacetylase (PgdA/CDA1 family)